MHVMADIFCDFGQKCNDNFKINKDESSIGAVYFDKGIY